MSTPGAPIKPKAKRLERTNANVKRALFAEDEEEVEREERAESSKQVKTDDDSDYFGEFADDRDDYIGEGYFDSY